MMSMLYTGHFGDCWFTELCRCSKCETHFILQYKSKLYSLTPPSSHQKHLHILGSWESHSGRYRYSETLIFAWELKSYHWQQILSVAFLKVKLTQFIFEKLSARTQAWPGKGQPPASSRYSLWSRKGRSWWYRQPQMLFLWQPRLGSKRCVLKSQELRKLVILILYEGHSEVKLEAFFTASARWWRKQ